MSDETGNWNQIYDTSEPVTDASADVYETQVDWDGTTKKTLVDATASPGWNFYKVSPKGPLLKGGVPLNFNPSETRYLAVWVGDNPPPPTYFYRGGATGSFAVANDWARTSDGIVPAVDRTVKSDGTEPEPPVFSGAIVVVPKPTE